MHTIYAVNGSPRRNKNTAMMLDSFLDGVSDIGGFDTERIDLFDYNIRGCTSCFACKRKDPDTYGVCALRDDVSKIIDKISHSDGVVFGSPIYFANITGQLLCFLERMMYPNLSYEKDFKILTPKKIPTAMIYTMNITEDDAEKYGYPTIWKTIEKYLEIVYSKPQRVCAYNTYQFDNYDKYIIEAYDESDKARYRDIQFPVELHKAYQAGARMAEQAKQLFGSNESDVGQSSSSARKSSKV